MTDLPQALPLLAALALILHRAVTHDQPARAWFIAGCLAAAAVALMLRA